MNSVRAEPECMALVGAIAVAWSEVEWALTYLVANGSGNSWQRGTSGISTNGNWAARVAMEQAETIRARLKLINAVLGPILSGHVLHDDWLTLQRRIQLRAKERNKIVHSRWGYSDLARGALIRDSGAGPEVWTLADLKNALKRISSEFSAVQKLTSDVTSAHAQGEILVPTW